MVYLCRECKLEKPPERVSQRVREGKRPFTICLDCEAVKAREYRETNRKHYAAVRASYYKRNKEQARNSSLKSKYGITLEEWNRAFDKQARRCAICTCEESGGRGWQTDHNHETGKFRSILCHNCNALLGHARENRETLLEAFHYLCKYSGDADKYLTERKYKNK